jgi:hypothetical protein
MGARAGDSGAERGGTVPDVVLFDDAVEDFAAHREPCREEHLWLAHNANKCGELVPATRWGFRPTTPGSSFASTIPRSFVPSRGTILT